jgi:hypothetical protein
VGANRNFTQQSVVSFSVAHDPTAAVEVDDSGERARSGRRAKDAQRDFPGRAGADRAVLTVCVEAQALLPGLQAREHGARFLGRERVQWRSTLSRKLLDEALDGRVQARNWSVLGYARCVVHLTGALYFPR